MTMGTMGGCLGDEDVLRLLSGEAGPRLDAVRAHLDACDACQDMVALCSPEESGLKPNDTVLGRYRIVGELGRGGMGIVYDAHDSKLDRELAIKVLYAADPSAPQRMEREARALARLSHPNIVTVFDVGADRERVCMVMELVRGKSLRAWLAEARPRARVLEVFRMAGEGLAAAHDRGILHRDFKPENVLVGENGVVKIVDFGLAAPDVVTLALSRAPRTFETKSTHRLTRTGIVVGTPAYMAPEQFDGAPADVRSDQFSFAVCVWEALFGTHPFLADTLEELRENLHRGPRAVASTGAHPLQRVLERALSPSPAARFGSVRELLAALDAASRSPRRRSVVAYGAAVLVALLAAALVFVRPVGSVPVGRQVEVRLPPPPAAEPSAVSVAPGVSVSMPGRAAPPSTGLSSAASKPKSLARPPAPVASGPAHGPNGAPLID